MKNQLHILIILLVGIFSFLSLQATPASADEAPVFELLVEYEDTRQTLSEDEEIPGVESRENITEQVELWGFAEAAEMKVMKKQLLNDPNVRHVEPNYERYSQISFNDPALVKQWWIPQVKPELIWSRVHEQKKDIVVAVIDSGIDVLHGDLDGRIEPGGYNFYSDTLNVQDFNGHGTAVAGVIAAKTGNGIGVAGITGTYRIKVLPLKVSHLNGVSKVSNGIRAIDYAMEKQVDIINLSLGSSTPSVLEEQALQRAVEAGITVVASAGNDAEKGNAVMYPAAYPDVISVGATDNMNKRASYSNYNNQLSLVAPGNAIYTTTINNTYKAVSGTSFSGPAVAGAAAMVKSLQPRTTPLEMKQLLESTATDLGAPGKDPYFGAGLLNLERLTQMLPAQFTGDFPDLKVEPDHVFRVSFNDGLRMNQDFHQQIHITRSPNGTDRNNNFTAKLDSTNSRQLLITPNTKWEEGVHYLRVDKEVKNQKGISLKKSFAIKFTVLPE